MKTHKLITEFETIDIKPGARIVLIYDKDYKPTDVTPGAISLVVHLEIKHATYTRIDFSVDEVNMVLLADNTANDWIDPVLDLLSEYTGIRERSISRQQANVPYVQLNKS